MARESSTIDSTRPGAYHLAHLQRAVRRGTHSSRRPPMQRRAFLKTAGVGAATLAVPHVLHAQSKDPIRICLPLPLTGPFAALACDMKHVVVPAIDELNAQ